MGDATRYNGLIQSKFRRCRLLTSIEDHNRHRIIKVYSIPGDKSVVGFHDGVDTWVGSAVASFRGVNLTRITGEAITTKPIRPRHTLLPDDQERPA